MPANRIKLNIREDVLWYLTGVITSDGCLSSDGRHISITAKDGAYLEDLRREAGLQIKVGIKNKGKNNQAYHLQISNVEFYKFLLEKGLSPKKSLIQKEVSVPNEFFADFCRGVIDGDGNIRKWTHPSNQGEQWVLRVYSGSREFIIWLKENIEQLFGAKGRIHMKPEVGKNDMYILKYGKMAAIKIFKNCYYENALAMNRKALLAKECCLSKSGWSNSKTIHSN